MKPRRIFSAARLTLPFASALVALLTVQASSAATLTWDTATGDAGAITDGSGTWSDMFGNWNDGFGDVNWANATPDDAIFGGGTAGTFGTVTLGSAITAGSLTFNTPNGGGAYTINTSTFGLTLNTGITANESATIQSGAGGSIILGANNTWSVAGTKTLTVSSLISGGFGLTKSGAGTLSLTGVNTYTGATTIDASSGTLLIGGAGQLNSGAYAGAVSIGSGSTFQYGSSAAQTLSGLLSGAGTLVKDTSLTSTLTLSGANTGFTGAINVNGGTLAITHNDALGTTAGATTVNGANGTTGTTLSLSSATSGLTIAENINLFGTSAGGRATLINDSVQSHTLNGAFNVTSDTNLAQFNSSNNTGSITVNGDITGTLANGAVLFVRGTSTNANNRLLGSVNLTGGNFAKTDGGTWLVGASGKTYSWSNTLLANGTLTMGAAGVLSSSTGALIMGENAARTPTLNLNGFNQTVTGLTYNTGTGTRTITSATAATLTVNNATDSTTTGTGANSIILTGSLALTKQGAGALSLNGANTFTGAVTITQGQLNAGSTTGFGAIAATTNLTLGGASTQGILNYTAAASSSTRPIVIGGAGGGVINSTTGLLTLTGTVNLNNGPLTIGGANNVTIGSATATNRVSGTGVHALTKTGNGTLTLSNIGTSAAISGAMPINVTAGTLSIVKTNATSTNHLGTGLITITPGATLTYGGAGASLAIPNAFTVAAASGTANVSVTSGAFTQNTGAITFAPGSTAATILRFNNSNGSPSTMTINGAISGTGTIQLNPSAGGSAITLAGAQNQTGSISNIGSSTQTATLSGAIGAGISGISQAGANPFTVSASVPLSAGLNTFTSTGAGLWTFSNANTFTGTQNLTFNANSTGGITVSGTNLNHTGTVTNSGSGAGTTTISSVIGTNVSGVTQNSATSQLTLSNAANTFTSAITVTQGQLNANSVTGFGSATATTNVNLGSASTVGTAVYGGGAAGSTRKFVVGGAAGGQLLNNGTGLLTLTAAAPILNLSAGPLTIGGSNNITLTPAALAVPVTGGNTLTKIGTGTVTLGTSGAGTSATISGATPIIITQGTLQQTSTQTALAANSLGTGSITFNPANGNTATLGMSFASVTNTYSNTINVDKPATGTSTSIISVSAGATFSGPIALGTGAGTGVATLRFTNTNGALFGITSTGGITGTGNISLNGTGANAPITLSTGTINITGTITNIGTNAAAASVATISAPITTTNLTAISQAGASPFTISSSLALTSALNSFTSTGAGLWTLSGAITGTQNLTFNANSTGGITVSGTNLNHTGSVTNSGTSSGTTTISSALGANVGNVVQNSATSSLVLSGSNTAYLGTMSVTQGIMKFQTTAAAPVSDSQISVASGATLALNVNTGGWSDAQINGFVGGTAGFSSGSLLGLDTGASNITVGADLTNINSQPVGLNKLGSGTLTLTGTNTYSGQTIITAGKLIASGASLSPNSNLNLFGTAVFTPTANFERPEGTAGGEMQVSGGTAGFSSNVSGGLTVAFGTLATPTTVTWGNATFNPTAFVLNDSSSTTAINFSSPIDLNGASRTVTVGSSTAATAATLSGVLSGATGGLTKTGNGILNITNTANSYAGATTVSAGTLSFNGGGSLSGSMALPSGSAVTVGNATTFRVLNDTAGTLAYGNTINLGGTQTIVVGNNGGATTGSTVAFGQLNAPATAVATATTTTFSSPNNYTTSFTGFALPGGTGNNTTLIANSNVIINGPVTNRGTGSSANFDTLFLQGTATGNAINGVIADAPTGSITAGNYTPVNKSGTGTWTLTGANTYTGSTTVSNGVLRLQDLTGSTRATGFQIIGGSRVVLSNPAGTLNVTGNVVIGNGTATLQNTQGVVVAGGATGTNGNISLLDNSLNTLRIKGNANATATNFLTLGTTVAAQPSGLSFDIGNTDTDQIVVTPSAISGSGKLLVQLGGATISLNQLPSTSITAGTYDLITFAAGSTFTGSVSLASAAPAGLLYNLKLNNANPALATAQQLEVFAGAGSGNVYWVGDLGTVWNTGLGTTATNFRSDYAGTTPTALPTLSTNVFFTSSAAAPANFASTTLGQGMGMNSLNFIGAAPTDTNPVGIGGALPLTISAAAGFTDQASTSYAAGIGLVMQSGAAATTISAPVILGGNQTWQLDSANGLISSGAISGTASLTKTGTGTLTLGGANTFSGGLTVSNGTVIANVSNATTVSGAAGPSTSTITLGGAGNSASLLANSFTVSNPIILGSVGANTATIGNNGGTTAAVFSGGVNLNGVDLTLTATGTTGTTTVSGLISGTGNLNYTPVVGTQVTVSQASYTGNTTLSTAGTVNLNQSGTSNTFGLLSTGEVNLSGGGILRFKADGAGTAQSIITGNGVTGNNVVVGTGGATLDVNRTSANAANAFVFNNLSINASQLNVTGANRYDLNFSGTTTLSGAATLNPTTAGVNLLGKVDDGGFGLTVAGTEFTRLLNTTTGGSANTFSSGTINVNGGNLVGYAPASGAGTVGSNTLGSATIALSGTNPVVNLSPSLGATLTNGTAAGLLHKTVAGAGNPASVNWLGATTAATTGGVINTTGSQTVGNINFPTVTGTTNVGHQFTGLLNITTPGMYNFSAVHDDGVSLTIDGVLVMAAAANATTAGSVYLPAGLHAFSQRLGQGSGGVGIVLSYQGPDTAGALSVIPASAFSSASSLADLDTSFANDFTIAGGTNATLNLAANTTVGTLTFGGTGATLNATGSNNITTLTTGAITTNGISTLAPTTAVMNVPNVTGSVGGTDTLVLNASLVPSTTFSAGNQVTGVIADGASGGTLALTKTGGASWTLSGAAANTYTGLTTVTGSGGTNGALILAKTGGALAVPGNLTIGNGTASQSHVLLAENEQISPTATVTFTGINGGWSYLQLQGRTQTIGTIAETTPGFGVIETKEAQAGAFGTSNVIFNVASGTQTYQGYFRDINTGLDATNSLKLTKTGSGTLQWGAAAGTGAAGSTATGHNYSGGTDIQNGTLQLLSANSASAISIVGAGNVSLNGGATFAGTLDLNNFNAGITGLDGTTGVVLGQVVNNGAATAILTVGNNGNSGSYAGLLVNNNNAGTGVLGLTKIGAGTQTLSGANAYSGTTTLSAGTLTITGTNSLNSPITMTTGGAGVLNINSTGTVNAGTVAWAGATAGTINLLGGVLQLNNASGMTAASSTANALVFNGGTLRSGTTTTIGANLPINIQAGGGTVDTTGGNITSSSGFGNTASPGTLNVIGGNIFQSGFGATLTGPVNITGTGTTVRFGSASAPTGLWTVGTGASLDLNNVSASVGGLAGGGNVLNTGASAARTLTITGAGGNTFSGSIQQPTVSATLTTGVTLNLSSTSATQTLTGAHSYSGATTITQGKLALTSGSLDNTAISVAANGTLGLTGSYTAGNATTSGMGASLNIAAGGTLNMQDAAIGTFTLTQEAGFAAAPLSLATSNLFFDINSAGVDQILVNGGLTAGTFTGTNTVNLNGLGASLTPGTYTLITAPGINSGNSVFKFDNGLSTMSLPVGLVSYPLTLQSTTAGIQEIVVGSAVGNYTWTGQTNGNGAANSVWTSTPAGNNNFADGSPAVQDYSDGSSVTFQDTNVIATGNVTNSVVDIDAAGVSPGAVTVNNSSVNYTFNTSGSVGIAGAVGLTKTGAGTLTLSSVNTYSGTTNINGGIVNVGIGTALGSGSIAFGGGTLQYGTGVTTDFSNRFNTSAGELISIDTNGNNVTFATALTSVGGSLTKAGDGQLTLSGASTFNGNVTVDGGTLLANLANNVANPTNSALGNPQAARNITVNNGGTLKFGLGDTFGGATTSVVSTLVINVGGTVTNNGNNFTTLGPVALNGGTLNSTGGANANFQSYNLLNTVTVGGSSASTISGTGTFNGIHLSAAGTTFNVADVTGSSTTDLTISAPLLNTASGTPAAAALTKTGAGTLTLSGANTYTGTTTVSAGTLQLGSATALGGAGALTMNGTGTLDLFGNSATASAFTSVAGNTITNSSTSTAASTATAPGTPSGAGVYVDRLTITTAGPTAAALITDGATRKTQIVLNNALGGNLITTNTSNTYSGGLVLANNATGTRLQIGTITGTPWGTGPIIVGQAATDKAHIFVSTANQTLANPIISNTALGTDRVGTFRIEATGFVLSGQQTANLAPMAYSTNGTGAVSVTGKITGSQGLSLLSHNLGGTALTVTLNNTLNGLNDYQGNTVINENPQVGRSYTLALGASDQIPNGANAGNVIINTNGTGVGRLNLGGFSETINGLSGNGTVDGISGTPTLTIGDNNATGQTFSGVIQNTAGTLSLTKIGSGTQILSGANTHSGTTSVTGGRLTVSNSMRNSSAFSVVGTGNTLEFGATNIFVADHSTAMAASRVITADAGTLLFNTSADFRFGNVTLTNGATWTSNRPLTAFDALLANTASGAATVSVTGTGASTMNGSGGIHLQGVQNFDVEDVTSSTATDLTVSMVLGAQGSAGGAAGGVNKLGAGTMTLTASNTYTGATNVSAGTLLVNGSLGSSNVTVLGTGTLGGSGTLGNGLTINAGGKLDLTGATLQADTSSVGILGITSGDLTLGNFTFADLIGWDYANAANGTYELIDGSFTVNWGATAPLSEATAFSFGNGKSGYFTQGSLNAVIIPEPSTALLALLGSLALLRRRR